LADEEGSTIYVALVDVEPNTPIAIVPEPEPVPVVIDLFEEPTPAEETQF